MARTLYFEGAGWEKAQYGDVPNCRIRTAFTNRFGKKIYLELTCGHMGKEQEKHARANGYKHESTDWMNIDFCFYITDDPDVDDCNESRLKYDRMLDWSWQKPWTMESIKTFVNRNLCGGFDDVVVLNDLSGYHVHGDHGKYNMGDEFEYDERLHMAMREKREELRKHFAEAFDQRFDNTSYWNASDGTYTSPIMEVRIHVSKEKLEAYDPEQPRRFTVDVSGAAG